MAPPMSAAKILKTLKDGGLHVVEVRDWHNHDRDHHGPWGPVHGVVIHHTATSGSEQTVRLCYDGSRQLPGPLCHGVITKDGTVHMVGGGRVNHAGMGDDDVLRAVIAGKRLPRHNETNTDGNQYFYGFECENKGDGKDPWPKAQLEAIEKVGAALCRAHGWNEHSVIGHFEWQEGKDDPKGFSMDKMRERIKARLK
ncbi:N-acetylmuramoyl-L-alanine amidase [Streptomyces sp. NPDC003077]|uniref:N-acetylmuramoyl-L-alanine amidase n=1 Tax=Streptomyces sp. NPDC003077 TaxID=3154443 RepID=UPI0033A111E7